MLSGAWLPQASRGSAAGREGGCEAEKGWHSLQPAQPAPTAKSSEHPGKRSAPTDGHERARAEAQAMEAQKRECAHAASLCEHEGCTQAQATQRQQMP